MVEWIRKDRPGLSIYSSTTASKSLVEELVHEKTRPGEAVLSFLKNV